MTPSSVTNVVTLSFLTTTSSLCHAGETRRLDLTILLALAVEVRVRSRVATPPDVPQHHHGQHRDADRDDHADRRRHLHAVDEGLARRREKRRPEPVGQLM